MTELTTLRFVALGDSLTRGYVPFEASTQRGHWLPYTDYLDNIVIVEQEKKGLGRLDLVFINLGVNGDSTRGMLQRVGTEVVRHESDYVIVWGGINDLFSGKTPEETLATLAEIYTTVKEVGASPIACTLTSVIGPSGAISHIRAMNDLIKRHCEKNEILLADLFTATSYENGVLRVEYSSDGVHLTAEGNKKIASTIYKEVVEGILDRFAEYPNTPSGWFFAQDL